MRGKGISGLLRKICEEGFAKALQIANKEGLVYCLGDKGLVGHGNRSCSTSFSSSLISYCLKIENLGNFILRRGAALNWSKAQMGREVATAAV